MKHNRLIFLVVLSLLICACDYRGKMESYQGITASGEVVTVPKSVLPSNIPVAKCVDKDQAINVQISGLSLMLDMASAQGGAIAITDDNANPLVAGCFPGTFEPAMNLLRSVSVPARLVAVRVKEPDSYFVAFVPNSTNTISWKKGGFAAAYQVQGSKELRVAFIDRSALLSLAGTINPNLMLSILDSQEKEMREATSHEAAPTK